MQSSKGPQTTPGSVKRRSGQLDFSNIGPLKTGGTVGFSAFRDKESEAARKRKVRKKSNGALVEDSDDDDDDDEAIIKMEDADDKIDSNHLAPEDAQSSGELADGVNRIHVSLADLVGGREANELFSLKGRTQPNPIAASQQTRLRNHLHKSRRPHPANQHLEDPPTCLPQGLWAVL